MIVETFYMKLIKGNEQNHLAVKIKNFHQQQQHPNGEKTIIPKQQ
jgi:hypothetical protein